MDETRTGWFRWIANNTAAVFWLVWGIGIGSFGAILFKAVDVGGDALRIYMGILTVMMGGALGLVSSRTMDQYNDQRKIRRKIFTTLVQVRRLRSELDLYLIVCREITREGARTITEDGKDLTTEESLRLLAHADRIRRFAQPAPDFDELVESESEAQLASMTGVNFEFLSHSLRDLEAWRKLDPDKARERAGLFFRPSRLKSDAGIVQQLLALEKHLTERL